MAIKHLTDEQIRTWTLEQKDRWWLQNVFRGDMPQLTLRSGITGFILGGLLCATNMYVGAKTGWSLGVGITSVILAFALFKVMERLGLAKEFTILENNAMQSIATAAGYMTAPFISSLSAYMIVSGKLLPWWQMVSWCVCISILGVLFAFPMKRRFINDEQHPFPEGRAAGVVMDTLHSSDPGVGMMKARVLLWAAGIAGFVKFLQSEGIHEWIQHKLLHLEDKLTWFPKKIVHLPEQLDDLFVWGLSKFGLAAPKLGGVDFRQVGINPALDVSLIGAGGLMGIRGGVSLLIGAILNYFVLAPWMIQRGDIKQAIVFKTGALRFDDLGGPVYGFRQVTMWALWPGVACLVVASLVAFFAKPQIIVRAFHSLLGKKTEKSDVLKHIELPLWISIVGIPIMSLVIAVLANKWFGVEIWACLVGLPLTFVLAMVAANSTALTSTTPVGATSKITQLFYGVVRPGNITTNIAAASITAEVVSNASNLLMDIKPGYMLGAKPRQQAIGHIIGIFAGSIAAAPLFFLLFTSRVSTEGIESIQSDKFPMPAVSIWRGVAKALTEGLNQLPVSVQWAVLVGALVGLALELARMATKGRFLLSPVGLGLAFVINFQSAFAMFLGSFFFWIMGVGRKKEEGAAGNMWTENHEPICAGVIAGAALVGIADGIISNFVLPLYAK